MVETPKGKKPVWRVTRRWRSAAGRLEAFKRYAVEKYWRRRPVDYGCVSWTWLKEVAAFNACLERAFYRRGQTADSFVDLFEGWVGEVEPHGVFDRLIYKEVVAWDEGHFVLSYRHL
jgi:hypothetical protein